MRTYVIDARAEKPGDGSVERPFRTIQKAAERVHPGDVCEIRGGVYRETVRPGCSGTNDSPVVFRPYRDECVTVTGCDQVNNWSADDEGVHGARVSLERGHENQVFMDDRMLRLARWPNVPGRGPDTLLEFPTAVMGEGTTPARIVDRDLPDLDWTGASVWVSSDRRWFCWTGKVTGYGPGWLGIESHADNRQHHLCCPSGKYVVFGARAELDTVDEWHYDADARQLRVRLPEGECPAGRVTVKRRQWAFDLSERSHIHVQGLNLFAASVLTDDASVGLCFDRLTMRYVYHSMQAERQYRSQADTGFILRGIGHTVQNSEIAYSSGNCLLLAGENCRVINNHIHDGNYIGAYAAPLAFGGNSRGHVISHNTIERAGRSVISTNGLYDCLLQYNDVGYAGYLTADLGLTYGNGVEGGNSELRYNWFHDNLCEQPNSGIYFDHGCKNVIIHHNVVWNVAGTALHNNQYANYLLYYNNTLCDAKWGYRSTWAAAQAKDLYGCCFLNNVSTGDMKVDGRGLVHGHNEWNHAGVVEKKYLTPASEDVGGGCCIEGIAETDAGRPPDCGAYPLNGPRWRAGHDFSQPPLEIDEHRSPVPNRNLLSNSAFHGGRLDGWRVDGADVRVVREVHGQWDVDGRAMMGGFSVAFGAGRNALIQTVKGLSPDTEYELMGMFRVAEGEVGCLSVRGCTGDDQMSTPIRGNAPKWSRATLRFKARADSGEAVVKVVKMSTGSGTVYVDDLGLRKINEGE